MPSLMLYATSADAELIREWINADPDVAWIVKVAEQNHTYEWKAVLALERLEQQAYSLWHRESGPLNIPSGSREVPDEIVRDPFAGWRQTLPADGQTTPWFGGNLPGPYFFQFMEKGSEAPGSLGRSGFEWFADRYRSIGKPAHPSAKRWWSKLRRFLIKNSTQIPWLSATHQGPNPLVYVFPQAMAEINAGRHRDINPSLPRRAA